MKNTENTAKDANSENTKLHNQDDVNPSTQLDKLVEQDEDQLPETNGTGSNRPLPTSDSVIIKDEGKEDE